MVVSCRKKIIIAFSLVFFLLISPLAFAENRVLTDAELDDISAGDIAGILSELESLGEDTNGYLDGILSFLAPVLDSGIANTASFISVNTSENSNVTIQTNFIFITNAQNVNVDQSNAITIVQ